MNKSLQTIDQPTGHPPASLNPFESLRRTNAVSSASNAEMEKAIAEVQGAIVLAKRFPRDKLAAADRILTECTRQSLAEAATYSFPKGGQEVTGPSIRLAEVLASNWGNFTYGWREASRRVDAQGVGISDIVCYAWDYETNVRVTREFSIRHWIDKKEGKGYAIKGERDIYELCANQSARRMRSAILNLIPGDLIEAAVKQCERTLQSQEAITPEKIKALLTAFEGFGISKNQIEKRIGRKLDVESINGAVMLSLRKIYNGLKDGMSRPDEIFEPDTTPQVEKPVAKPQTAEKPKAGAKADDAKKSAPDQPYDPETGEITENGLSDWSLVVDELIQGLQGSKSMAMFNAFLEESSGQIRKLSQSGDRPAIDKWAKAYNKRQVELIEGK